MAHNLLQLYGSSALGGIYGKISPQLVYLKLLLFSTEKIMLYCIAYSQECIHINISYVYQYMYSSTHTSTLVLCILTASFLQLATSQVVQILLIIILGLLHINVHDDIIYMQVIEVSRSKPHTSESTKESGCGLSRMHILYIKQPQFKDPFLILSVSKLHKEKRSVPSRFLNLYIFTAFPSSCIGACLVS